LLSANASIEKIEAEFRLQPELSLKLLKLLNTCNYCLRHEIKSIKHGLMLIGCEAMRKWLTIMLYAGKKGDVVKSSLLETAMLKAHTLELLTVKVYGDNYPNKADAFFIGLLSFLDVILGVSKQELLSTISVKEIISDAILERKGDLGVLLSLLEAADDSESELTKNALEKLNLTEIDITEVKFEGLNWLADQQAVYENM
jgi:EAL and modified HD-GYP domain-containing signal transduction protein